MYYVTTLYSASWNVLPRRNPSAITLYCYNKQLPLLRLTPRNYGNTPHRRAAG